MSVVTHPFVTLGVISTSTALFIATVGWYQRESRGAIEYTVVMVLLAGWSLLYVLQLLQPTIAAKQPFLVARHVITPLFGIAFWLFVSQYTDRPALQSTQYLWPLGALAVVIMVLVMVNPGRIYWVALTPAVTDSIQVVDITFGPALWLNVGYTLGLVGVGHLYIISMYREALDVYQQQLAALVLVGVIELSLTLLFLSEHMAIIPPINPWPHIQLITYGTTLVVIPLGWFYFNGALFKLQPLAERTVIENMSDAVFVFDQNDTLRYANSKATQLLGMTPESSIVGQPAEVVLSEHPALLAQYQQTDTAEDADVDADADANVDADVDAGVDPDADVDVDSKTLEFRLGDETRVYDLRDSTIRTALESTAGSVLVARDVTNATRQRTKLRERTAELERKNEQLNQFTRFISHDLRNPLQVAHGYVGLVQQSGDLDHLDEVDTALKRMDSMIDDLRELTRLDQATLTTEPVRVCQVAKQAWGLVDTGAATLDVESTDDIIADRELLLHVFENLFRNSIDHTDGDVTVRVRYSSDELSIEDDGPGIPPEDRESVLKQGYTTSQDGTGLGLVIVTTIAAVHGWEVSVEASTEGGARFVLSNVESTSAAIQPEDRRSERSLQQPDISGS